MARVVMRPGALPRILKSPAALAEVARMANAVVKEADQRANDPGGHRVDSQIGRNRARAAVITATPKSMWKEAVEHTLLSAFGAARRG